MPATAGRTVGLFLDQIRFALNALLNTISFRYDGPRASDFQLSEHCMVRILCCRGESWASSFALICSSSLSCTVEYLVVDYGGYFCTIGVWALIAPWLDVFQRS